ncbi:anthrone oxygenase family protein [Streptomyces longisporoflavus]|uniref:Anthrone oxygenase family protein n=1 Tax=Streptomyces longisporoflavus TaxID=28044 RepID=A0ABW7QK18_9ACTN
MNVRRLAHLTGLVFSGLFAGFLLAVLVLENSLRSSPASVYTQVRHVELDALDKLALATLAPAAAAVLVLAVLAFRTRARERWFALAALLLMAAIFIITASVNVPINNDQLDWSVTTPPADWENQRNRWQLAHLIRTLTALTTFAVLATAMALRPDSRAVDIPSRSGRSRPAVSSRAS